MNAKGKEEEEEEEFLGHVEMERSRYGVTYACNGVGTCGRTWYVALDSNYIGNDEYGPRWVNLNGIDHVFCHACYKKVVRFVNSMRDSK